MTEIQVVATSSKNTLISAVAQPQQDDIWDEFLRLQISNETKRTYAGAIDNFFMLIMGSRSSPQHISEFLRLSQYDAIAIVLPIKAVRALEEWLLVRGSNEKSDPLFISLDNRTKGMKLSTMSIGCSNGRQLRQMFLR